MRYINRNFTTVYQHKSSGRRMLRDTANELDLDEVEDTNSYVNNKAVQSDSIASYPGFIQYIFFQNNDTFSSAEGEEVVFAPGQDLKLSIEIYDQEGRLANDE